MADKANYKAAIIYRKNSNNAIAMGAGRGKKAYFVIFKLMFRDPIGDYERFCR